MNRKLHNTFSALFASTGLLVLSLIAATPMSPQAASPTPDRLAQVETSAPRMTVAHRVGAQPLQSRRDQTSTATEALAQVAAFTAEAATAAVLAEAFDEAGTDIEAEPATPRTRNKPRRNRQSVAMPYFSFAPRG